MGINNWITLPLVHPVEFWGLFQFYIYYKRRCDSIKENPASGWDRKPMRRCWELLQQTSRSFSAVVKVLDADLAQVICIYYLVMRGLDTIEDDMTIPDKVKHPILRAFHSYTVTPGWTFDGCGPNEKGRQLLVEFDNIVDEVNFLSPAYKSIIIDMCRKMGTGMVDLAHTPVGNGGVISLHSVTDYERYGRCVAGLVFQGLTQFFSASGKEDPWTDSQMELSVSLALFLQKADIICDFHEDVEGDRYFWPKEIWGRAEYGGFNEMRDMWEAAEKDEMGVMYALSAMTVNALLHATDALDYLTLLKNQSVFNFYGILATKGIATLELCFMNREVFKRNLKIRKVEVAKLLMRSTNLPEVSQIFCEYVRKIRARADVLDPNFLQILMACDKIEQWRKDHCPSSMQFSPEGKNGAAVATLELEDDDTMTAVLLILLAIIFSVCIVATFGGGGLLVRII